MAEVRIGHNGIEFGSSKPFSAMAVPCCFSIADFFLFVCSHHHCSLKVLACTYVNITSWRLTWFYSVTDCKLNEDFTLYGKAQGFFFWLFNLWETQLERLSILENNQPILSLIWVVCSLPTKMPRCKRHKGELQLLWQLLKLFSIFLLWIRSSNKTYRTGKSAN